MTNVALVGYCFVIVLANLLGRIPFDVIGSLFKSSLKLLVIWRGSGCSARTLCTDGGGDKL